MPSDYPPPPPASEDALLARAQRIAGLSFAQLAEMAQEPLPTNLLRAKGWAGQLLERCLGATAASLPQPDFQQIGVELKTIPIDCHGKPRESTYVCTVPLTDNHGLNWETSWVRLKLQRVLWLPIEGNPDIPLAQRRIGMAHLWSPTPQQEHILRQDWEELMDMVCLGHIKHISARHGTYLQIRPKAANANVLCAASDENGAPMQTLPRGFYLRSLFTGKILAEHYAITV